MKIIILLAILLAAVRYDFGPARQLDEEKIRAYYELQTRATLGQDPQALCDQLAEEYHGSDSVSMGGRRHTEETESC